jgi:serine/threonine protein kinase
MKISDFGFATSSGGNYGVGLCLTKLGTPEYAAPEILMNVPYVGAMADIFALGVSLFIMVTRSMPFI